MPDVDFIQTRLLDWYDKNKRDLAWRRTTDPYRIWVSEIMLQQTKVDTVGPYFERFISRFPSIGHLAEAERDAVLKLWEGLGYYSRARNLHAAAGEVLDRFSGTVPNNWEDMLSLKGVGPYVAGAVLSIAYGVPVPAVDGNVRRVYSRLFAYEETIDDSKARKWMEEKAASLVHLKRPGDYNQAVMELGAMICSPKKPDCTGCPLSGQCEARIKGIQNELPVRTSRKPVPKVAGVAAIIKNSEGKVLLVKRPADGFLGGLWKWPGERLNEFEDEKAGLERTIRDELGIDIKPGTRIGTVTHQYTHFHISIGVYVCRLEMSGPNKIAIEWNWVNGEDMDELALSRVDQKIALLAHEHALRQIHKK